MARNPTTIERDRLAAKKVLEEKNKENDAFLKLKLKIESDIEKYDAERKVITANLHDKFFKDHASANQLKVMRRRRRWLKKERDELVIKLDLIRK